MSSSESEDKKIVQRDQASTKSVSEYINLMVINQDGRSIKFKIKKQSTMRRLMLTYCERMNISRALVKFRFDGDAINEANTPKQLGMEDGDSIEVFQEQLGGYRPPWRLAHHLHFRKYSLTAN